MTGYFLHPSTWLLLPAAFLAGGFARRVAGGVLATWTGWVAPGVPARLFFGAVMGAIAWGAGAVWWFALALGVGVWLGHITGLHEAAGMGRVAGVFTWRRFWIDFAWLSLYGLAVVGIGAGLAVYLHDMWPALLIACALVSPIYALAWAVWERGVKRIPGFTGNPLELGEWLFGGCVGVGSALVCLPFH